MDDYTGVIKINQLVTLDTAKLAKLKEFNISVYGYYTEYLKTQNSENPAFNMTKGEIEIDVHSFFQNNSPIDLSCECYICYSAPTQSKLQKWIRDEHNIHITTEPYSDQVEYDLHWCFALIDLLKMKEIYRSKFEYKTFEGALEYGLQESLKFIKK